MASPPRVRDLQALLRAWADDEYPTWLDGQVIIRLPSGLEIRLPIVRLFATTPPATNDSRPSRCAGDILLTLEEAGHRLTRTQLLAEMSRRGREWSDRSVAGELARMVEEGILDNERGSGYGRIVPESTSGE